MDIGSKCGYPACALSNFAPHPFVIDGVKCNSMEGFLQSLKFKEIPIQEEVCKLVGSKAKYKGKPKKWYENQTLYWRGVEYKRDSKEYQELLDRAYYELSCNSGFRDALIATHGATLTHSIGKSNISETVLTKREFCGRLTKIRERLILEKEHESGT